MGIGAWRRRGQVTENGVESIRLPAKSFLKDMYLLALELLYISSTTVIMGYF
jgi:hypothetical protein